MNPKKDTQKSTKRSTEITQKYQGFTDEERAAMKARAQELKAETSGDKTNGESAVLAKIAELPEPERTMGLRLHAIIQASAPALSPRLWYGMPAYAKDGKVVCFFQDAAKFKARYCTLGFQDPAQLDEGSMWATSFAITALTRADEKRITDLVRRAVG